MNFDLDTAVLMIASLFLVILMWGWHSAEGVRFNLTELVTDSRTHRVSLSKCGQLFALLVSTWVLIHETRASRLSEWLFWGYMLAWTGANLANKAISRSTGAATKVDTNGGANEREQ